mmetsp:Transcript_17819/g.41542  ORF Transcript_17819/g.41542 Transcript_17819/m.41542 type:complete len:196 (-) Transcript_17819:197-784(-)
MQIETMACGLVVLAHLVLLEPKLGQSRQARLEKEKDFLGQLLDLRHWITHRQVPPGWNPDSLVTAALRAANAYEGDLPVRALPQVSTSAVRRPRKRSPGTGSEGIKISTNPFGISAELFSSYERPTTSHVPQQGFPSSFAPFPPPGTAPARIGTSAGPRKRGSPGASGRKGNLSARDAPDAKSAFPLPPLRGHSG